MILSVLVASLAISTCSVDLGRLTLPQTERQERYSALQLSDGAKLEFDLGEISAGYSVAYLAPPSLDTKKVKWDVSRVRGATAVIYQVSRAPFGRDCNPAFTPRDVVSQSREEGQRGSTYTSVGKIATEYGYIAPATTGRGSLSQPDRRRDFLRDGGQFTVYLRVIPIASTSNPVPVGLASPPLQLIYAKAPPAGVSFPSQDSASAKKPSQVECLSVQYTPYKQYCHVHPNPSVCAQVGKAKPWWEQSLSFLLDAWNWTCETYQKAKKMTVDIAASALPFVPREALELALDGALAACGLPPNIPNLDQLMEQGADYLAGEVVAQIGPPVAGDLANSQIKKAILAGAKAAAKKVGNAGPEKPCEYNIEWPYMVVTLRNKSSQPIGPLYVQAIDWTGIYATNDWNGRLFKIHGQVVSSLKPGASLPVFVPLMPDMHQKKHFVQGGHQPGVYWHDFNTKPSSLDITVSATYDPQTAPLSVSTGKWPLLKAFIAKP